MYTVCLFVTLGFSFRELLLLLKARLQSILQQWKVKLSVVVLVLIGICTFTFVFLPGLVGGWANGWMDLRLGERVC